MWICNDKPVEGAVGFEIFIATGLDLAAATEITIHYEKPSGAVGSWTATADVKDGAYGATYITASEDDLDEVGTTKLQVGVIMPGFSGRGAIATLKVLAALPDPVVP